MPAMVILPSSAIYPKISALEAGSHFMCERAPGESEGSMAIYQIIKYDYNFEEIFKNMNYKIPAVNCSTGFMRLFLPDTQVKPVKMILAPQDVVKIADKDTFFVQ